MREYARTVCKSFSHTNMPAKRAHSMNVYSLKVTYEGSVQQQDQDIAITVYLLRDGRMHAASLPFDFCLIDEAGEALLPGAHLKVKQEKQRANQLNLIKGKASFTATVMSSAPRAGNRVSFRASADADGIVANGETDKFIIYSQRLEIIKQPEPLFYKDEGGRNACLELRLRLNSCKSSVKHGRIPLDMEVYYEGAEEVLVHNQEILVNMDGAADSMCTDLAGEFKLRFRIEEVSKNHRKQRFCLRVSPNQSKCPSSISIAPVMSTPIQVLSKRKSRPGALSRASRKRAVPEASPSPAQQQAAEATSLQGPPGLAERSGRLIAQLEWQVIGHGLDGSALHKCPVCQVVRGEEAEHSALCELKAFLNDYSEVYGEPPKTSRVSRPSKLLKLVPQEEQGEPELQQVKAVALFEETAPPAPAPSQILSELAPPGPPLNRSLSVLSRSNSLGLGLPLSQDTAVAYLNLGETLGLARGVSTDWANLGTHQEALAEV
ncbi:unnamed protein product [Chrysoparadoxa australica]